MLGLEVPRQGQPVNQCWLFLMAGLGQLRERFGLTEARSACLERIYKNLKHVPIQAICMEKPLKTAWVGLKVGWGRASENHRDGANSVNQVDGNS